MNKTLIEWVKNPDGTQGYTWNPITGCLNNCSYCYARKLANGRLRSRYLANKKLPDFKPNDIPYGEVSQMYIQKCFNDPFYPRFWPERLADQFSYYGKKAQGIFVCDMSDLFGIGIPKQWTEQVMRLIGAYPQHRFYLLTKQPQNLVKFSPFPDNCYVGVTITSCLDGLYPMEGVTAKIKYISFEPLLYWSVGNPNFITRLLQDAGISWVIIGAQTKPSVMPRIEWVEEIVRACDKAGVAVFLKDNLSQLIPINSWLRYGPAGELRLRQELLKEPDNRGVIGAV